MRFTIPATAEELTSSLSGLDRLLTAKHHERAGIVYAWTTDGIKGGPRTAAVLPQLSARAFADLKLAHLSSDRTVREYREAWERTAALLGQDDLLAIKPGDMVELPDDLPGWKDPEGIGFGEATRDVQERVTISVLADPERGPSVMAAAALQKPQVRQHIAQAVALDPVTRDVVRSHMAQARDQHTTPVERGPLDPNDLMRGIANAMHDLADNLARINAIAAEHPEVVRRVHEVTGAVGQPDYFRQAAEALLPELERAVGTDLLRERGWYIAPVTEAFFFEFGSVIPTTRAQIGRVISAAKPPPAVTG